MIEPIKGETQLSKILSSNNDMFVKIYTQSKRIASACTIMNDTNSVVTLKIQNLEQLKSIKCGDKVKLMEVIQNGLSIRGIRECRISSIDYVNGVVVIELNLKFTYN